MPFFSLVMDDHLRRARNVIDSEQTVCEEKLSWREGLALRGGAFAAGSEPCGPVVQGLI